jgi:hypothetical protein
MNSRPFRKRRSIFLGLVLMLIGVLILIHNLQPRVIHLGELFLYWPVLLILWGLALLWDVFAARRAKQPIPRTVGRSEVLLILIVAAASVALLAFNRFRINAERRYRFEFFGNPYTFTQPLEPAPIQPSAQVLLWTPRGNITVRPHQDASLSLVVTKTVRAMSQSAARAIADATAVAAENTAQGVRVEPRLPRHAFGETISYDAGVSPRISLNASTGRGDLHISGINGPISANASGEVDISRIGSDITLNLDHGDLRIRSVDGNVTVHGRGEQVDLSEIAGLASLNGIFFGPIRIRRIDKGLQIRSPRTRLAVDAALGRLDLDSGRLQLSDTQGNVTLRTRDLDVEVENAQGTVRITNRNGDVDLHCGQPPRNSIHIDDRSGNIDLFLPGHAAFSLMATALSGDITNDFPAPTLHLVERSSNSYMQGSVGSGGPKITLYTTYGAIRIMRTPASPPMPPVPSFAPASPGKGPG